MGKVVRLSDCPTDPTDPTYVSYVTYVTYVTDPTDPTDPTYLLRNSVGNNYDSSCGMSNGSKSKVNNHVIV